MISCNGLFRKHSMLRFCTIIVTTGLMTGCVTDPVTGKSTPDPKYVAAGGALVGGVAGAFLGKAVGGQTGLAIGAAAGASIGGLAGYYITNYLNEREQQEYVAQLNQQMKTTPANITGTYSWMNSDRSKTVNTSFTQEMPVQRVSAKLGNRIQLNQQRLASLPPDTTCRAAEEKFPINGKQASTSGVWCRVNGDYIKVDGTSV